MVVLYIILFLIVLTLIVSIHEFGHYYFAKKAGVLAYEFSIGMGPSLYQKQGKETVFSIRAIPLGGFVAMSGEQADSQLELIKKDQEIGLRLNENGLVTHLVLNLELEYDVKGFVESFELIGQDMQPLNVCLKVDDELKTFEVLRNAIYDSGKKGRMQISPYERSFANKTKTQRFLILFGGPLMNFILAFVLLFGVSFFIKKPVETSTLIADISKYSAMEIAEVPVGKNILKVNDQDISGFKDIQAIVYANETNPLLATITLDDGSTYDLTLGLYLQRMGISNVSKKGIYYNEAIVGQSFGRASKELKEGDQITNLKTASSEVVVNNWEDIYFYALTLANDSEITVTYKRDGVAKSTTYSLISDNAVTKLGSKSVILQLGVVQEGKFDFLYTISYPFKKMGSDIASMATTLALLVNPKEKVGISDLSGPVGIYSLVSSAAKGGVVSLIVFTAFLSVNIGMLNLLPIPALDGGQILFVGIEALTKKKIPHKVANIINNITFYLLLALIVFVTYNDILRLFR